jgi:hypothetical protein
MSRRRLALRFVDAALAERLPKYPDPDPVA